MNNKKLINLVFIFLILLITLIGGSLGVTYLINKNYDINTIISQKHIGDITISNKMYEPYEWQLRDQINKYNRNADNNYKIISIDKSDKQGYNEMVTIGSYKIFNNSQTNLYFNMYQEQEHNFTEQPNSLNIDITEPDLVTDTMIIALWCANNNYNSYDFIGIKLMKTDTKTYALIFTNYVPWVTINIPHSADHYAMLLNVSFK